MVERRRVGPVEAALSRRQNNELRTGAAKRQDARVHRCRATNNRFAASPSLARFIGLRRISQTARRAWPTPRDFGASLGAPHPETGPSFSPAAADERDRLKLRPRTPASFDTLSLSMPSETVHVFRSTPRTKPMAQKKGGRPAPRRLPPASMLLFRQRAPRIVRGAKLSKHTEYSGHARGIHRPAVSPLSERAMNVTVGGAIAVVVGAEISTVAALRAAALRMRRVRPTVC